jgi:hypothetical protein
MKIYSLLIVFIFSFLLAGCGDMIKGKGEAEKKIPEFHALFNGERFDEIYDSADAEFQKAASNEKFGEFIGAIHRKLGKVTGTTNQGWKVNNFNLRTYVNMQQETTFENGKAMEIFIYIMEHRKPVLHGYHINSADLIIK